MINKIHSDLMAMKDDRYRDFSSKIINTSYPVIGVRMPDLRAYAKTLSKNGMTASSAHTGMPQYVISTDRPITFIDTVLPPVFGPVIRRTRCGSAIV